MRGTTATLMLGLCPSAWAGGLTVQPTQIALGEQVQSQVIMLHNSSDEPLRFELHAAAWTENLRGEMALELSRDITVFPLMVTIQPNASRSVRVATTRPPRPVEASYRVLVTELPAEPTTVKTRVSIPVFVQPSRIHAEGSVQHIALSGRTLQVTVANTGTVHAKVDSVVVTGINQQGRIAFTAGTDGWFVLPSRQRTFEVELPHNACEVAGQLDIVVDTDTGPWTRSWPTDDTLCSR